MHGFAVGLQVLDHWKDFGTLPVKIGAHFQATLQRRAIKFRPEVMNRFIAFGDDHFDFDSALGGFKLLANI